MKTKTMLIIVTVFAASTLTYGALAPTIGVELQKVGFYKSVAVFTGGFECACADPMDGSLPYSMENCITQEVVDQDPSLAPFYIGDEADMLCEWETTPGTYGGNYLTNDEGCAQRFWIEHSEYGSEEYQWPPGLEPSHSYLEVFQTTFTGMEQEQKIWYDADPDAREKIAKLMKTIKKLIEKEDLDKDTLSSLEWIKKAVSESENYGWYPFEEPKLNQYFEGLDSIEVKTLILGDDRELIKNLKDEFKKWKDFKKNPKDLTLLDALKQVSWKTYNKRALASESTAALLNSDHSEINYVYSPQEVIMMTQKAIVSGDYKETIMQFREQNSAHEPLLCP